MSISYPNSINTPYLFDIFNVNSSPNLTLYNSQQLYQIYYPYTATEMSSYKQVTNNKKYWPSPYNGTSIPMEINNSLYKSF